MTSGQFYCILWALFLRQNGFYCLMNTVDLGEESPLDIVLLKENNPLKTHKTLISWPLSFYGCEHVCSAPWGTGVPRDLSCWSLPYQEIFSSGWKALKVFRHSEIFSSVFSLLLYCFRRVPSHSRPSFWQPMQEAQIFTLTEKVSFSVWQLWKVGL